jgi:hypothetical protein
LPERRDGGKNVYIEIEYEKEIPEFPIYTISNRGRVHNNFTGRQMVLSPTIQGDLTVGLMKHNIQYRRSVKSLVAKAFVPGETNIFNTPIQLDGDKENLDATNIVWRPRWFAHEYAAQFRNHPRWYTKGPLLDVVNQLHYETVFEAAIANGILCKHIQAAIPSDTYVFPTGQKFIYI